jgi:hypothetical protein
LSALSSFVVTAANVGFPELLLVGSQVQRIHTFRPSHFPPNALNAAKVSGISAYETDRSY